MTTGRRQSSVPPFIAAAVAAAVANLPWVASLLPAAARLPDWVLRLHHPMLTAVGNAVTVCFLIWGTYRLITGGDRTVRLARTLERRRDPVGAAELYHQAGSRQRALRLFRKGRAWTRAAEVARELGRLKEAAALLRMAGGRSLADAATLYRQLGELEEAQRCDHELAEWLMSEGHLDEAVIAWMRAGEPLRAARAAGLALEERRLQATNPAFRVAIRAADQIRDHGTLARLREMEARWTEAAHAWRAAGDMVRAAENFRRAGRYDEAAACETAAGRTKESINLRFQSVHRMQERLNALELRGEGEAPEAVRLRRELDDQIQALIPELTEHGMESEVVELLSSTGRVEEAVRRLVAINAGSAAADLAQNAQRWDLAAPLLEELGRWGEASDVHELAGDITQAAICAERAGEDERALQLYASSGRVLEAAHCRARLGYLQDALTELHRAGLLEEACQVLETHPGPVPDIPDVVLDLAQFCRDNDRIEQAVATLQRAVIGVALRPTRMAPAVALARSLFDAGEADAARAQLDRVLAFDYSYEPARQLRERMDAGEIQPEEAITRGLSEKRAAAVRTDATEQQRYEILNELGRGGMGVVYQARDTRLERDVAIKVLRTTSEDEVARLQQEAKAAATLNHPGIVTIYDFEAGFDGYFIAMEFVPGEPLDKLLRSDPERIRASLLPILIRLADAVAYAHAHHVVHRDLKPGNVLVTSGLDVKILDFGIAARLDSGPSTTPSVCGTPYYMAPEQIRGEAPTPASDLYSLGASAFHLATGRPPFARGNVIDAHLKEPPPDPLSLRPELDPRLGAIILRCLAKEPEQRFSSAGELADELRRIRSAV